MFLKLIPLAALAGVGSAVYFNGLEQSGTYSRDVSRPISEVKTALEDLDMTAQPGAPGTDPSKSGGVRPLFRLESNERSMTWYVMSGDKVAVTMTAFFEPLDNGKSTRVTTKIVRGDAPDDFVSPAFRSVGITTGLFNVAIEDELNDLVTTKNGDSKTCEALMERFENENLSNPDLHSQRNATDASADQAKIVMRLNAMEAEMRQNGCPLERGYEMRTAEQEMAPAQNPMTGEGPDRPPPIDPASFSSPSGGTQEAH